MPGTSPAGRLDAVLATRIADQKRRRRYRQRRTLTRGGVHVRLDGRERLAFCSNDYLGLADDPRLAEAMAEGARRYGSGSGASALISGYRTPHEALEGRLAEWTGRRRALLFTSGYQANQGVLSVLAGRGDHVVHDRLNHASLLDATRLAGARLHRYLHADCDAARDLLARLAGGGRRLLVSDGVFSMGGDCADVAALARIAGDHAASLVIDDAHGLGVLGESGAGVLQAQGMSAAQVPVLIGTLGKALGTEGAFVAGSDTLIEALTQFSRAWIYTTSPSPALAHATLAALDIVRDEPERRAHLEALIGHFRREAKALTGDRARLLPSGTPIQPLIIGNGDEATLLAVAQGLEEDGLWCGAIRPPTVPAGSARLRITLSAAHDFDDIDRLLTALQARLPSIRETPHA
nr:8-amino-7-oxononanoate synthase [Kushneria aurantia]